MLFYNTNDRKERVTFQEALLRGAAPKSGLYTIDRDQIPKFSADQIKSMADEPYYYVAGSVLWPLLSDDMTEDTFWSIFKDAYDEKIIPVPIQYVTDNTYIMWLTKGPTSSFKDFAARFFARALNYYAGKLGIKLIVVVATSGDTGPALSDALAGQENLFVLVVYPGENIYPGQKKQMTTIQKNVIATEVKNGDFNLCQDMCVRLMADKKFAKKTYGNERIFTSANSISLGRLLPQIVFPFYAYSQVASSGEKIIISIPSGNFGDATGATFAMKMGLPIEKIIMAVNENDEFPRFLNSEGYKIGPTKNTYSSAMDVNNPNNLPRLFDLYGGHMVNLPDKKGFIRKMPDLAAMRRDLYSVSVNNDDTLLTMHRVYREHKIILDPHGAVGWCAYNKYLYNRESNQKAVVWETADPCKFPDVVREATRVTPMLSKNMAKQVDLPERRFIISSQPNQAEAEKAATHSEAQYAELKQIVADMVHF